MVGSSCSPLILRQMSACWMSGAGRNLKSIKLNKTYHQIAANSVISPWSKSTIGESV
jgi:hypothetical protein